MAHIHPPVPHYLLLGASQTHRYRETCDVKKIKGEKERRKEGGKVKGEERRSEAWRREKRAG